MARQFPFLSAKSAQTLLRISVSLIMMAHGVIRIYAGTVGGFGEFLNSKGFIIGKALAWGITIFEITGGAIMASGSFVKWICMIFIIEHIMGIILVHAKNGWFVVGHQSGGVEYSVLLIISFIVIAANRNKETNHSL
ncbi:MAG: DoxX family protein [Chitinophagaceae bacterium]|nr:DoxX family protein [Chitinophagaceae bacterium]